MFRAKRINLTLNARQIGDAQILAALEELGGESASVLKALALRGIMSDPALSATLAHGIGLMANARKAEGCGFGPRKPSDNVLTQPVLPLIEISPPIPTSAIENILLLDINNRPDLETILPASAPVFETAVLNVTKPTVDVRRNGPESLSDFLRH